jgi:alginate O-acetyltransferase complex protein AlgI
MLFTSWTFLIFFVIVLAGYFTFSRSWRWQNILLLAASYISYGFWDWRFLGLILGMTVVNYGAGWAIDNSDSIRRKRFWLGLAIAVDIIVLGIFKYLNFFDQSLITALSPFGVHLDPITLKLILPLGISYLTFMEITYPFEIYRGKMKHNKNFLDVALFMSFFPTIVSGPVERASHMLPQFQSSRKVTGAMINEGLWLIGWGFFQKMVIADNIGLIVSQVYGNYTQYQGMDLIISVFAYMIQVFADLGGYTDIARGIAKIMGFDLLLNFNVPYFIISPADYWSRWHISFSSWLRDFLYIPLGGSRKGELRTNFNIFITFILCGLWHGAAWTYIAWGAYHGILQVIFRLFKANGTDHTITGFGSGIVLTLRVILMVCLVAVGLSIFSAYSFQQVIYYFTHLSLSHSPETLSFFWRLLFFTIPIVIVQIFQLRSKDLTFVKNLNPWVKGIAYGCIIVGILVFSQREIVHFIYQAF